MGMGVGTYAEARRWAEQMAATGSGRIIERTFVKHASMKRTRGVARVCTPCGVLGLPKNGRSVTTSQGRRYGNMLHVFSKSGAVVNKSKNLAGVRRYAQKVPIRRIDLVRRPNGEGEIRVVFDNGAHFHTLFASWVVMEGWVKNWRNARGVPVTHHNKMPFGDRRTRRTRWTRR